MKFLYIQVLVKGVAAPSIMQALRKAGHEAEEYPLVMMNPTCLDDENMNALETYIHGHHIDYLISIHFVLDAAFTAYRNHMKYIAILWDAPFSEIYNPLGKLGNVYVSTFDKLDRQRFLDFGVKHVIYQPLSVDTDMIEEWDCEIQETLQGNYFHDISFVGQLYDKNFYDMHIGDIPMKLQGYFNSIFEEAAFRWDGINRIYGKTGKEVVEYIKRVSPDFMIPNRWEIEDTQYFERMALVRKIANIERIAVLNLLAESYDVTLYTGSRGAAEKMLYHVNIGPPVVAGKAVSLIYAGSKINLNITLKGIEQGTPQRIIDIMGAGGFVLSGYCPETAELFEEDKEIVFFKTPEELLEKVDYYLLHDEERRQIAMAGRKKVMSCYNYDKKIRELLAWIEEESDSGTGVT